MGPGVARSHICLRDERQGAISSRSHNRELEKVQERAAVDGYVYLRNRPFFCESRLCQVSG
jgi:hypothetical protein